MIPFQSTPLFSQEEAWWREPLNGDRVALHFTLFLAKGYQTFVRGSSRPDPQLIYHYIQTIALLQRRLAAGDEEKSISDATMQVVIGLGKVAAFRGDVSVARQHLEGLYKMVMLRGGLQAVDRKLMIKIC